MAPQKKAAPAKKAAPKKETKKDDDDVDFFGDSDDSDDGEAAKMLAEKQKKAALEKAKKKVKPPGKSMIVFDVKVHDEKCDFDKLAEDIMDIEEIPKLQVNEAYDTVDIAYGMQKLRMGIIVQDDCEVGVDEF